MKIDTKIYNDFINNLELLASYILDDGTYIYGNYIHTFTNVIPNESINILNNFLKIIKNFCTFTNIQLNNDYVTDEYYEEFLLFWQGKYYNIRIFYNLKTTEIRYLINLVAKIDREPIYMDNVIAFAINILKILNNDERKR